MNDDQPYTPEFTREGIPAHDNAVHAAVNCLVPRGNCLVT